MNQTSVYLKQTTSKQRRVLEIMLYVETAGKLGHLASIENIRLKEEGGPKLCHYSLRVRFRTQACKLLETVFSLMFERTSHASSWNCDRPFVRRRSQVTCPQERDGSF